MSAELATELVKVRFSRTLKLTVSELHAEDSAIAALQEKYIGHALTGALSAKSFEECQQALCRLLRSVLSCITTIDKTVRAHAREMMVILDPPTLTLGSEDAAELTEAISSANQQIHLVGYISRFPMHGGPIFDRAVLQETRFSEARAWLTKSLDFSKQLMAVRHDDEIGMLAILPMLEHVHLAPNCTTLMNLFKDALPADEFAFQTAERHAVEVQHLRLTRHWLVVQARVANGHNLDIWNDEARAKDAAPFIRTHDVLVSCFGAENKDAALGLSQLRILSDFAATWTSRMVERVVAGDTSAVSLDDARRLLTLSDQLQQLKPTVDRLQADEGEKTFQIIASFMAEQVAVPLHTLVSLEVKAPTEKLVSMFRTMNEFLCKEFAIEPVNVEKLTGLADGIWAEMDPMTRSADKVIGAAVGFVAVQRAQFLSRYTRCCMDLLGFLRSVKFKVKESPIKEDVAKCGAALQKQADGFTTWWTSAAPKAKEVSDGWDHGIDVEKTATHLQSLLVDVIAQFKGSWSEQLNAQTSEIKAMSPAKAMLDTARILGDAAERMTFATISKKLHESKSLNVAGEMLVVTHLVEVSGRAALIAARRFGKLAIAVNFVVSEIIAVKPKKPGEMMDHITNLRQKLKCKGIGGQDRFMSKRKCAQMRRHTAVFVFCVCHCSALNSGSEQS